jgi:hypothetical protein
LAKVTLDARRQLRLPERRRSFQRLAQKLNPFLFLPSPDVGRAQSVCEAGSLLIFRRQSLTKMLDGLPQFALMNEDPSEVKMGQPVGGTIFERLAVMLSRLAQPPFPFDNRGVIVMSIRVEQRWNACAASAYRSCSASSTP